jgi:hypothetical protein
MRNSLLAGIIVTSFVAVPGHAGPQAHLSVVIPAAVVDIEAAAEGRRLVSLPTLELALSIEPACDLPAVSESLSISVADTSKTITAADLQGKSVIETTIIVPAEQMGPIAVDRFCGVDNDAPEPRLLRVNDAFSAHLSLRCADGDERSIVYVTSPLTIDLRCSPLAAAGPGGQESVPEPAPRF